MIVDKPTVGYIRRAEAAKYLGVAERTLSDWQARRIVPFVRVGRKCVMFSRQDLDRAMEKFKVEAAG